MATRNFGVLMTCPMMAYLEGGLQNKFTLYRLWQAENPDDFVGQHAHAIQAVVGDTFIGASAELIDALPNLQIVATFSVGLDKVDLAKCRERRIAVTNTPDVLTDDVADLAVALMLATLRHICASHRRVRQGFWPLKGNYKLTAKISFSSQRARQARKRIESIFIKQGGELSLSSSGLELSGKSIGIIGLGRIGLAIAKRAEAFGCSIAYHSRSEKPDVAFTYYSSILELAARSDILVLSCPSTKETYHIINRAVLDALGPKAILVNIGRGSLVDENELVKALVEGRVGGAGLDVFENEPYVPNELFGMDNVVLLPHVGSSTWETSKEMSDLVIANLEAYFSKKPLLTPVE